MRLSYRATVFQMLSLIFLKVKEVAWQWPRPFQARFVICRLKGKAKVLPYSLPSVGPNLMYRQSARKRLEAIHPAVNCHYFPPGLRLPLQPKSVTVHRPIPNYAAWWQRHMRVSSLSKAVTWKRTCRDSNPRPFGLRANALPLSHTGHQRFPQPCAVYILDVRGLVPLVSGLGLCMIWATTREMTGCITLKTHGTVDTSIRYGASVRAACGSRVYSTRNVWPAWPHLRGISNDSNTATRFVNRYRLYYMTCVAAHAVTTQHNGWLQFVLHTQVIVLQRQLKDYWLFSFAARVRLPDR